MEVLIAARGRDSLVSGVVGGLHADLADRPSALKKTIAQVGITPFAGVLGIDGGTVELAVAPEIGLPHNPAAPR